MASHSCCNKDQHRFEISESALYSSSGSVSSFFYGIS